MIWDEPRRPFRERIDDFDLQAIYDFWRRQSEGKRYPSQRDLDLSMVPRLAPNCFIMDVLENRRFRYRYMGTDIDSHLGANATGMYMDEFRQGAILETLTEFFGNIAETGHCGFMINRMATERGDPILYRRVVMPISDDGEHVNKLLGGWTYQFDDAISYFARDGKGLKSDQVETPLMIFDQN